MASGSEQSPLPMITNIKDANDIGMSLMNIANNMTNAPDIYGTDWIAILNFPIFNQYIQGVIQIATNLSQSNASFKKFYKRRYASGDWGEWILME